MVHVPRGWFGLCLVFALGVFVVAQAARADDPPPGVADWSDWEEYRHTVVHPATVIKPEDIVRAKQNAARYDWAKAYLERLVASANGHLSELSDAYIEQMIETTTPGTTGPCPACRAKGLPWHPNGQWSWSSARPDELQCTACRTTFPNEAFPETVEVESRWGKGQKITFVGGDTFVCFGYRQARPSLSSIIRARKLSHMTSIAETLALAYVLTDDPRYARGVRPILLRLADVFPEYLVRAGYGYGETAGMDPHLAARRINNLPEDELVYPPNKPDRRLYTGYWSATRIGTSGMDGGWVVSVTLAYDLTCTAQDGGTPIYSEEERKRIEHDLLLESAYLALCDPAINNKSVGNRAGAAVVGLCVGHPGLVHFGLEGFQRCVDEWFLPDGGTSESPAYAMMTMNGIAPFALALRDYSDPPGYQYPNGRRLDGFNACRDTRYGDCWQALIWTLQGDLHFPPSADSYRTTRISGSFAELLAAAYPTEQHLALLQETVGGDRSRSRSRDSLFLREPGLELRETAPLELPEVVFPFLAQGYLRTGDRGRDSLLLLNASDYGGHHHLDSLDLYYWKDGHELLSDLGYLWDHPDKYETYRTLAHNLVMIDGRDQQTRERGGRFHLFSVTPRMKVMEASSNAYGAESLYRRTCVLVDHGPAGSYVLDIFRARGGSRRDYVFHGPGKRFAVEGISLSPASLAIPDPPGKSSNALTSLQEGKADAAWRVAWTLGGEYEFHALAPGLPDETVYVGEGWGQRDHRNTDRGSTLPYIVRRRTGADQTDLFVSVFAGNPAGQRLVHELRLLPLEGGDPSADTAVAVSTTSGVDVFVSTLQPGLRRTTENRGVAVSTDGRVAGIFCDHEGTPHWACLLEGTHLQAGDRQLSLQRAVCRGDIIDVRSGGGESCFVVRGEWPENDAVGQTLFAIDEHSRRAYPILAVQRDAGQVRIFTKRAGRGFDACPAQRYELPLTAAGTMGDP